MKKQHGYTAIELMMLLIVLSLIAGAGFAVYVLSHFLSKFW